MNKLLMGLAVMIVATLYTAADEPLAFKGLALGASEQEVKKQYPYVSCDGSVAKRTCFMSYNTAQSALIIAGNRTTENLRAAREMLTVAGVSMEYVFFYLYDDRLGRIMMNPNATSFDRVAMAFIDRYGKPDSEEVEPVTTKSGVVYQNRKLRWKQADGQIWLERFGNRVDRSILIYVSSEGMRQSQIEEEERRKKAVKDL